MNQTLLFLIGFVLVPSALADQWVEDFTSLSTTSSSTAIVNFQLGVLHPTLLVANYEAVTPIPLDVPVGDGSHGPFNITTYANFSIGNNVAGNIIRLDTSVYPILNVTDFHLANGWVLEPVGINPLIIYSLSDVVIEGQIWCYGDDGGNGAGATPGTGGLGRCGGGDGGDGGLQSADGEDADPITASVTGGKGGNFTGGAAVGGGGGGTWNTSSLPGNGVNSTPAGGQAGGSDTDPHFSDLSGAAGGGGGSGSVANAGGGGGGGGGTVVIYAVRDFNLGSLPNSNVGLIHLHGGSGGSSPTGGPGGGGGGGSIQVFVGQTISIFDSHPLYGGSPVNGGVGGGVNGGGGIGRNWFSSVYFNPAPAMGFYTPAEQAPVIPGNTEFEMVTQEWISLTMDTMGVATTVQSVVTSPVSGDFLVELAGSNDNFILDNTGWDTDLTRLDGKRYLRMKISITNSNPTTPTFLDSVTVTFDPGTPVPNPNPGGPGGGGGGGGDVTTLSQFDFVSTGCGSLQTHEQTRASMLLVLLPFFLIGILKYRFS